MASVLLAYKQTMPGSALAAPLAPVTSLLSKRQREVRPGKLRALSGTEEPLYA